MVRGQVVSLLAFYLDDLSSNPAEGYSLLFKICILFEKNERTAYLKTQQVTINTINICFSYYLIIKNILLQNCEIVSALDVCRRRLHHVQGSSSWTSKRAPQIRTFPTQHSNLLAGE